MPATNEPSNSTSSQQDEQRIADEAITWFSRLRMTGVTLEDRQAFERWCYENPAHKQVFQRVSDMWDSPVLKSAAFQTASTAGSCFRPYSDTRFKWWSYSLAAAAVVVLLIMATVQWDLITRWKSDYYTSVGERRTIQLPDQSSMTLNTQTSVVVAYEDSLRKIRLLKGQAFFKVQANPQRPFVVEHDGIATRAVGTEFVVRAEPRGVHVTVVEGLVGVSEPSDTWTEVTLGMGKQVRVEHGKPESIRDVDAMAATAWLRGRLIVTSVGLGDVIQELRRYYPGTILIWNSELENIEVTGTYNLTEPRELLTTLSRTLPFHMVSFSDRLVVLF